MAAGGGVSATATETTAATGTGAPAGEPVPFPSLAWFERLADAMRAARARHEHLGYVDCVAGFVVTDAGPFRVLARFEEFECTGVQRATAAELAECDFVLEATLATWRTMIESIAAGGGRPALEQTLNRLSHMGTPLRLTADDPLRRDLYFRYNQSLQEFVNASGAFRTVFPPG